MSGSGSKVGTLAQLRQFFNQDRDQEKFISWNPKRYGFDSATYCAVVVVNKGGTRELYPARNPDEAQRVYHVA